MKRSLICMMILFMAGCDFGTGTGTVNDVSPGDDGTLLVFIIGDDDPAPGVVGSIGIRFEIPPADQVEFACETSTTCEGMADFLDQEGTICMCSIYTEENTRYLHIGYLNMYGVEPSLYPDATPAWQLSYTVDENADLEDYRLWIDLERSGVSVVEACSYELSPEVTSHLWLKVVAQ